MPKAIKKPVFVEYITFAELVKHGISQPGANIVKGQPWYFTYKDLPVTQEDNLTFIISTPKGNYIFTADYVLITENEETFPVKEEYFKQNYVQENFWTIDGGEFFKENLTYKSYKLLCERFEAERLMALSNFYLENIQPPTEYDKEIILYEKALENAIQYVKKLEIKTK